MLTLKVTGVEGGREPACSEFPSAFVVSIVPTQRQFTLSDTDQIWVPNTFLRSLEGLVFTIFRMMLRIFLAVTDVLRALFTTVDFPTPHYYTTTYSTWDNCEAALNLGNDKIVKLQKIQHLLSNCKNKSQTQRGFAKADVVVQKVCTLKKISQGATKSRSKS